MKKFNICFTFDLDDDVDESVFFSEHFKGLVEHLFCQYVEDPSGCYKCNCQKLETDKAHIEDIVDLTNLHYPFKKIIDISTNNDIITPSI